MVIALAADVGVLQGELLRSLFQEGTIETALQDGPDRCDRPGSDREAAPTSCIETYGLVASGQR
jgi:hypothetical protein